VVDSQERDEVTIPESMKDPCWDFTRWAGAAGRRIDSIICHYTLSGDLGNAADTRATVDRWHKARGFIMVGYNYLYTPRGEEAVGRPEYMQGAHCIGWNAHSIGLCSVGSDAFNWYPTEAEYIAKALRCKDLMTRYPLITIDRIWPHNAKNATSCPGLFDTDKLKQMIQAQPEVDMFRWSNRSGPGMRVMSYENNVFVGVNKGQQTDEDVWLAFRPIDSNAMVEVKVVSDDAVKSHIYPVERNKIQEVGLSGFGLTGPITYFMSSNVPVVFSEDDRGREA